MQDEPEKTQENINNVQESSRPPELDTDILTALGEVTEDVPKFGENIHDNLARLWTPILRKGLDKEIKEKLQKQILIPENCSLLQAPKLNPEIAATISDATRYKDKRVETSQQQLGLGIAGLNRGLSLLLENDNERIKAIKLLSDSSRLLCDLHHSNSEIRKKFVTPGLEKTFLSLIKDEERDETLFGQKLSEKIKASRAIEKQGLQIKKPGSVKAPLTPAQPTTSRPRTQGNWSGPPRYTSNRGGRNTFRKTGTAGRKGYQAQPSTSKQSNQSHHQPKPRAPAPQQ